MDGMEKRAARAAYKERKQSPGIYAVRCTASGQVWIGGAPNLDTIQNRIWFGLRLCSNPNRDLQRAWIDHGEGCFAFEVLERLEEEESPYVRDSLLKERTSHWRIVLGGASV